MPIKQLETWNKDSAENYRQKKQIWESFGRISWSQISRGDSQREQEKKYQLYEFEDPKLIWCTYWLWLCIWYCTCPQGLLVTSTVSSCLWMPTCPHQTFPVFAIPVHATCKHLWLSFQSSTRQARRAGSSCLWERPSAMKDEYWKINTTDPSLLTGNDFGACSTLLPQSYPAGLTLSCPQWWTAW